MSEQSRPAVADPPGGQRAETQRAILDSAITQFSRRGFHGASMRQLAAEAGITLSNVYNYFPTKSDILLGILRQAVTEQIEITGAAIEAAAGGSVVDRFLAGVEAFVRYDVEHLDVCFVANSELRYLDKQQREEIVVLRDRQQGLYEDLVKEGVASGDFRTPYPTEVTTAMLTMFAGVTVWYRPDGPLTPDEVAERYSRYALAMVEAKQDAPADATPSGIAARLLGRRPSR
jgi:TetR/AcrR family transcriptional regulator, cholesterol catabolism regulator